MKSAYELAMERLAKQSPTVKLTNEQKAELAELDSLYKSKLASREIALKDKITQAQAAGNFDEAVELDQQLASERKKLQSELEDRKEQVRQGKRP